MGLLILSALYVLSLREEGEKTAAIKKKVEKRDQNVKVLLNSKVLFASCFFCDDLFKEFDFSLVCLVHISIRLLLFSLIIGEMESFIRN